MVKPSGFSGSRVANKAARTTNLTVNHNKLRRRAQKLLNDTEKRVQGEENTSQPIQGQQNALIKALAFAKQKQAQQDKKSKTPKVYGKPPTTAITSHKPTSISSSVKPTVIPTSKPTPKSTSTPTSTSASTSTSTSTSSTPSYVLSSHQGFINVAFEEWILQHMTGLEQHELWAVFQTEWAGIEEKYHYELPPHTHRPFNLHNYTKMLTKHQHKAKFRQDVKEARVMLDAIARHYQPSCEIHKKRRLEEEEQEKQRKEKEQQGEEDETSDSRCLTTPWPDIDPIAVSPHATIISASPHLRALWNECWLPAILKRPHETLLQYVKRGGAPPSLELINAITATIAAQQQYDAQHATTTSASDTESSRKRKR